VKNPICRVLGHKTLCTATATLMPDGGAILRHEHECLRCKRVHTFHDEWLDPAWEALLRAEIEVNGRATTLDVEPAFVHRVMIQ